MMKINQFIKLFFICCLISCAAQKSNSGYPDCIADFINKYKNEPRWHVGSVDEFEFQGKLIYAFNPSKNLADGSTLIKSADCKDMCSVGGFAGLQNNQCNRENFFEKAILKRNIWTRQ